MENAPPSRFRDLLAALVPLRKLDVACNVTVEWLKNRFHQLHPTLWFRRKAQRAPDRGICGFTAAT
jgi:hypothetical protein